jgi:L-alanine-DL-glutamate epimerase-like enolase superfamily enzyme
MDIHLAGYSLYTYRLPYLRPVQWSDTSEDAASFLLLKIEADSGHMGVAEMTLKPTWTGATLKVLVAAIGDILMPELRKCGLDDIGKARAALDRFPENQAAKAMVDNALWDLHAGLQGQPLWKLWRGRPTVELSWAVTRQAPAAMAIEAAAEVERHGYTTLKVKGGQGIETDLRAMKEIRSAVGDGVRLYVDANGAYAPRDAAAYVDAMAGAGARFVEDPCALAPGKQFKALQDSAQAPVLVDFNCRSPGDARIFLESGARALSIKPGRYGLSDARDMAGQAHRASAQTVIGLFGESLLGTLAALQLASLQPPAMLPAETSWFLAMSEQIVAPVLEIRDGKATLPDAPSLADWVDWGRLEKIQG